MNNPEPRCVDQAIENARHHQELAQALGDLLKQIKELVEEFSGAAATAPGNKNLLQTLFGLLELALEKSEQLEAARSQAIASIANVAQAAYQGQVSILPGKLCQLDALAQVYALPKVLEQLGELEVALGAA